MDIQDSRIDASHNTPQIKFRTWSAFVKFIIKNKDQLQNCIFRGQRNPDWSLTPTFYRIINGNMDESIRHSNFHLENFKKNTRGRHTISYTDPNDFDDNWWALGQHYGLATPLLDWVSSPYVAAFFSFHKENSSAKNTYRSVHILDFDKIENILTSYNRGNSDQLNEIRRVDPLTHENQRLVSQQGIFTFIQETNNEDNYSSIDKYLITFRNKFAENIGDEILHLKILIRETERNKILEHLDLMNINESTLFPDLNGAAAYCNYLLKRRE